MSKKNSMKPDKFDAIIELVSEGDSVVSACKKVGVLRKDFYKELDKGGESGDKYARALELRTEVIVEDLLTIADDTSNDTKTIVNGNGESVEVENKEWVNRSKLRIDTRKWIASKLLPRKYGDKTQSDVNLSTSPDVSIVIDSTQKKL